MPAARELGHLLGVVVAFKGHVLGFGRRLHLLEQRVQREADPGNHDGPRFDAAMPVDAFFERCDLEQTIEIEGHGLGHFALHLARVQGEVRKLVAFCAGSSLSVPNS